MGFFFFFFSFFLFFLFSVISSELTVSWLPIPDRNFLHFFFSSSSFFFFSHTASTPELAAQAAVSKEIDKTIKTENQKGKK